MKCIIGGFFLTLVVDAGFMTSSHHRMTAKDRKRFNRMMTRETETNNPFADPNRCECPSTPYPNFQLVGDRYIDIL